MQVSALRLNCEQASDGPLADARAARNKLRNKAKKAQKQQQQLQQAGAAAADLIAVIHEASDVMTLETVLAEAQKWAGLVPALDEEIFVGQERLQQLRVETQAARKTTTIEVRLCAVCIDADMTQLLYPCGHQCMCLACAEILEASTKECPVCRAAFMGFCNVYRC